MRYTSLLAATCLIASGCATALPMETPSGAGTWTGAVAHAPVPSIQGQLSFGQRKLQALFSEVINAATVSLIDPSPLFTTVATGVSSSTGAFNLSFPASFSPTVGRVYYLEAVKGLGTGAPGKSAVRIRTMVQYTSSGWLSLTSATPNASVTVNVGTTVLSIGAAAKAALGAADLSLLIGKYPAAGMTFDDTGNPYLTNADFSTLYPLVDNCVTKDQDPVEKLTYQSASSSWVALDGLLLEGTIYKEDGTAITSGTTVKLTTFSPNSTTVVPTTNGHYGPVHLVTGVPTYVTASATGYSTRTQVVSAGPSYLGNSATSRLTMDFGGNTAYGNAAAYLTQYPEVTVGDNPDGLGLSVTADVSSFKLNLSQPLDATNQAKFSAALRVYPTASAGADPSVLLDSSAGNVNGNVSGQDPDLKFLATLKVGTGTSRANFQHVGEVGSPFAGTATAPYFYAASSRMMGTSSPMTVAFNPAGTVATVTIAGTPASFGGTTQVYQVALVSPPGGTDIVASSNGLPLGTNSDEAGDTPVFGGYSSASGNRLIYNAFAQLATSQTFTLPSSTTLSTLTPDARFAASHYNVDFVGTTPQGAITLQSVSTGVIGTHSRLTLTFNRPMASYGGSPNRIFENVLAQMALRGGDGLHLAASATAGGLPLASAMGTAGGGSGVPFANFLDGVVYQIDASNATAIIDPNDARNVFVNANGATDLLPAGLSNVRVRVGGGVTAPDGRVFASALTSTATTP